ncbi:MAG TPA: saccharopine dehydrogenase NADP-binding domain-containing protein, partial [Candidatus Binatia bacterium]|nr:saccharopine dehydrogenase NADP-binding domain-containing protein [Candidatus Binatia bacterium]
MAKHLKHVAFSGRMIMLGCGSIGQGVLPLILRHIALKPEQITIVTADNRGRAVAARYGIKFVKKQVTQENFLEILGPRLREGDFLVNLSVEISSLALLELCHRQGALYLDTCIEPWPGGYTDPSLSVSQRSNYALREQALALRRKLGPGPTAVIAHGANPGLVSHFVKRALLDIARDTRTKAPKPKSREEWAALAQRLGVKVMHIAERDTQVSPIPKRVGEFVNTWSIDGFVSEGSQPAELGWGTHERELPPDGARHAFGCDAAIYLNRPGLATRVRTWTPIEGPFHGWIITHNESISMADFYTVREKGRPVYRPTVHYAYHPCDQAVMSM